jgi:hypothetical protein
MKKNIIIIFYLLAIVGLGTGSLLVGQRISDTQKKVTPLKVEAKGEEACLRCCGDETKPGNAGPEYTDKVLCGGCGLRTDKDCEDKRRNGSAENCWKSVCISCTNLAANTNDFKKGQTYTFHCSGKNISGLAHIDGYVYRYKIDNSGWTEKTNQLPKAQWNSEKDPIGFQLKIEKEGKYTIQCRSCTQMGCSAWEAL